MFPGDCCVSQTDPLGRALEVENLQYSLAQLFRQATKLASVKCWLKKELDVGAWSFPGDLEYDPGRLEFLRLLLKDGYFLLAVYDEVKLTQDYIE
jgi:hypothetical protein